MRRKFFIKNLLLWLLIFPPLGLGSRSLELYLPEGVEGACRQVHVQPSGDFKSFRWGVNIPLSELLDQMDQVLSPEFSQNVYRNSRKWQAEMAMERAISSDRVLHQIARDASGKIVAWVRLAANFSLVDPRSIRQDLNLKAPGPLRQFPGLPEALAAHFKYYVLVGRLYTHPSMGQPARGILAAQLYASLLKAFSAFEFDFRTESKIWVVTTANEEEGAQYGSVGLVHLSTTELGAPNLSLPDSHLLYVSRLNGKSEISDWNRPLLDELDKEIAAQTPVQKIADLTTRLMRFEEQLIERNFAAAKKDLLFLERYSGVQDYRVKTARETFELMTRYDWERKHGDQNSLAHYLQRSTAENRDTELLRAYWKALSWPERAAFRSEFFNLWNKSAKANLNFFKHVRFTVDDIGYAAVLQARDASAEVSGKRIDRSLSRRLLTPPYGLSEQFIEFLKTRK